MTEGQKEAERLAADMEITVAMFTELGDDATLDQQVRWLRENAGMSGDQEDQYRAEYQMAVLGKKPD
jgi:hypothetical protein